MESTRYLEIWNVGCSIWPSAVQNMPTLKIFIDIFLKVPALRYIQLLENSSLFLNSHLWVSQLQRTEKCDF